METQQQDQRVKTYFASVLERLESSGDINPPDDSAEPYYIVKDENEAEQVRDKARLHQRLNDGRIGHDYFVHAVKLYEPSNRDQILKLKVPGLVNRPILLTFKDAELENALRFAGLNVLSDDHFKSWRDKFHTVEEITDEPTIEYIKGFLPEGITMLGSLSGVGKSLFAFSMAKAITTGKPFLGKYETIKTDVLYLCPEMGEKLLKKRALKFGLSGESFLIASMKDGLDKLDDPHLIEAIKDRQPIVFLDTAIRFSDAKDENASSQNQNGLFKLMKSLILAGAKAVVCLHHSPKSAMKEQFTLESTLRGTGDIGAMSDACWGLRWYGNPQDQDEIDESMKLTRFRVKNLKPRDLDPIDEFVVQGRPFIDEQGDFVVTNLNPTMPSQRMTNLTEHDDDIVSYVKEHPDCSIEQIAEAADCGKTKVYRRLRALGWEKCDVDPASRRGGTWKQVEEPDTTTGQLSEEPNIQF
jgi:hypothetical protein